MKTAEPSALIWRITRRYRSAMRRRRAALLATLAGLTAFGPISTDLYLPGLPRLAHELSASAPMSELTLTACILGLAVGQILLGPASDILGRRRPLMAGLVVYVLTSVACAAAPNIAMLIVARFVQGCAGGCGIVIALAIVRDLQWGRSTARTIAGLLLIAGAAPMLAPSLGALLLKVGSWRVLFLALSLIGVLLLFGVLVNVEETLLATKRHQGGTSATLGLIASLCRDGRFAPFAVSVACAFAAGFSYISASPLVFEGVYGLSPATYGLIFALTAGTFLAAAQLAGWLSERMPSRRLIMLGLWLGVCGGVLALVAALAHTDLYALLAGVELVMAGNGLVVPTATAFALDRQGDAAGTAAALLGFGRFALAAGVAPIVGISGVSAVPMAICMAAFGATALAAIVFLTPFRPAGEPA